MGLVAGQMQISGQWCFMNFPWLPDQISSERSGFSLWDAATFAPKKFASPFCRRQLPLRRNSHGARFHQDMAADDWEAGHGCQVPTWPSHFHPIQSLYPNMKHAPGTARNHGLVWFRCRYLQIFNHIWNHRVGAVFMKTGGSIGHPGLTGRPRCPCGPAGDAYPNGWFGCCG